MRIYQTANPNTNLEVMEWKETNYTELLNKMKDRRIAKKLLVIDGDKKEIRLLVVYRK